MTDTPTHRYGFVHNAVAHPLLVVWPRLGTWIHDHSQPLVRRRHLPQGPEL